MAGGVGAIVIPKEELTTDPKLTTPKEVISYWSDQYFHTYEVNYAVNWGRDTKLVKKFLVELFTPEQIKTIIDIVFKHFDEKWATPRYPRPHLGVLGWIPNQALAMVAEHQKRDTELAEVMAQPENGGMTEEEMIAWMDRRVNE